jgi:hypothetical protein
MVFVSGAEALKIYYQTLKGTYYVVKLAPAEVADQVHFYKLGMVKSA